MSNHQELLQAKRAMFNSLHNTDLNKLNQEQRTILAGLVTLAARRAGRHSQLLDNGDELYAMLQEDGRMIHWGLICRTSRSHLARGRFI
jgi:hypothetical protein